MAFDPFAKKSSSSKKPVVNTDSFLEALKDIGGGVVKGITRDVVGGTAQTAVDTILNTQSFQASGDLKPGASLDMEKLQAEKQQEQQHQAEHRHLHFMRSREELVFSAKEEQVKKEINELKEELKKLAAEMGNVAHEVQVAALQETAHPGSYHVSFFEHLRSLIRALRQKLSDSGSWLATINDKTAKKKGYWGQFKSKGTSFSQNQERTLATQAG